MPELREAQHAARMNQEFLVAEMSGESGLSAGEVKLARQWIERILRDQENRRGEKPGA